MKIVIGSKNPNKIEAVRDVFTDCFNLDRIEILSKDTLSNISDQPLSLDETISGAMNRAKNSFENGYDFSVGIEGGLIPVPQSHSGYMQCEACVLYDGASVYLGLSGAFNIPKKIIESVIEKNLNLSDALKNHGYTKENYIGHKEGAVGLFSKGFIDRKKYTENAVHMALVHYLGKEVFL